LRARIFCHAEILRVTYGWAASAIVVFCNLAQESRYVISSDSGVNEAGPSAGHIEAVRLANRVLVLDAVTAQSLARFSGR
jgi:hypothetical protein